MSDTMPSCPEDDLMTAPDARTGAAPAEPEPALGVERSLSGARWQWRPGADSPEVLRAGAAIAQRYDLPEIVGRLMALRGIRPETAETFLSPTLRALMPDPSCMQDMDIASARLAAAVRSQETVAVFGDYDVDGACSSAILSTILEELGCTVHTHIPDRMTEGYGPNAPALLGLVEKGASLIVCLDCGTAAADILSSVKGKSDVIVIDHHKSEGNLPDILATVNPNRPDCTSGLGSLCAAALTFLTTVAMLRELRQSGWFTPPRQAPDLRLQLDLVALATVCDVMPLTGLNRAFVRQGLHVMKASQRLGLRCLAQVAGMKSDPSVFSCGYTLGPRINAGGRIAAPDLGWRLLTTKDAGEATDIAERLNAINRRRQDVEAEILDKAMQQAEAQNSAGNPVLVLCGQEWHPGVVGIVASRVKERFNRPSLVCSELEDGQLKGSGRSVPGLDLGSAVIAAREHGLLTNGGGHMMAAGFSLSKERLEEFHQFLNHRLSGASERPDRPVYEIDALFPASAVSVDTARALNTLAPFGQGHEEPLIALTGMRVTRCDHIGSTGTGLRVFLSGEGNRSIKGLIFGQSEGDVFRVLKDTSRPPLSLIGYLRHEIWNGREDATFFIRDAAFCSGAQA